MIIGQYKIRTIAKGGADKFLDIECQIREYNQLSQKIASFSFDSTDGSFDTWTEVAKYILDTFTTLPSHKISIKDKTGTHIASEDHGWINLTVLEVLNDICQTSNSFLYLDEYSIPAMGLYATADLAAEGIEAKINLIENNVANDISSVINSVVASLTFVKEDTNLASLRTGYGGRLSSVHYAGYVTCPSSADFINGVKLLMRKKLIPPGGMTIKLFDEPGSPPRYDGVGETVIGTKTVAEADISESFTWIYFEFAAPVDASPYRGKRLYVETNIVHTDNNNTYEFQSGPSTPYFNSTSDNSVAWSGSNGIGFILVGDGNVTVSGSYSDTDSIDTLGLYHRDLVAKQARTDDACVQYATKVVEFYKDGYKNGTVDKIISNETRPGQRVLLHDPISDLYYENLFVNSIRVTPYMITAELTEKIINIVDQTVTTDSNLFTSDQMLLG